MSFKAEWKVWSQYACDIKLVGINVCSRCLISENNKNVYPRNIPAIWYQPTLTTCI